MLVPKSVLHEMDYYSVTTERNYSEYHDIVKIFFKRKIEKVPFLLFWLRYKIVQRKPLEFKFRRAIRDSNMPGHIITSKDDEFLELIDQLENFVKQVSL